MKNKFMVYFSFVLMLSLAIIFGFSTLTVGAGNTYSMSAFYISLVLLILSVVFSVIICLKNKDK